MKSFLSVCLLVGSMVAAAAGDSRVEFLNAGNGNVGSSLVGKVYNDGDLNIIYTQPTFPYESGMQVLYRQLVHENTKAPLATVYLYNAELNVQIQLMASFDTISQACSCYWIDAKDLGTKPGVATSTKYQLWFKSDGNANNNPSNLAPLDVKSGYFGITVGPSPSALAGPITSKPLDPTTSDYKSFMDVKYGGGGGSNGNDTTLQPKSKNAASSMQVSAGLSVALSALLAMFV
jgi:hypothetical protein